MKIGNIVFNKLKNRNFTIKKIDVKNNLIISEDMFFLYLSDCEPINYESISHKEKGVNRSKRASRSSRKPGI